jgi:hypothetical protein
MVNLHQLAAMNVIKTKRKVELLDNDEMEKIYPMVKTPMGMVPQHLPIHWIKNKKLNVYKN